MIDDRRKPSSPPPPEPTGDPVQIFAGTTGSVDGHQRRASRRVRVPSEPAVSNMRLSSRPAGNSTESDFGAENLTDPTLPAMVVPPPSALPDDFSAITLPEISLSDSLPAPAPTSTASSVAPAKPAKPATSAKSATSAKPAAPVTPVTPATSSRT